MPFPSIPRDLTPQELGILRAALQKHRRQIQYFMFNVELMLEHAHRGTDKELDEAFQTCLLNIAAADPILEEMDLQAKSRVDRAKMDEQHIRHQVHVATSTLTAKPPLKRGPGLRTPGKKIVTSQPPKSPASLSQEAFDAPKPVSPYNQYRSNSHMFPQHHIEDDYIPGLGPSNDGVDEGRPGAFRND